MRSRILTAVGVGALALATATMITGAANAAKAPASGHAGVAGVTHFAKTAKTCYSQGTQLDGNGVSAQNFEAAFDAYDDYAADDFKVKKKCKIHTVAVSGQYSASGGVQTANVFFYKGKKAPGKTFKEIDNASVQDDGIGDLTVTLGKTVKLKKGHYWVGVQANLDFSSGGQWYWDTASDGSGAGAMWENPGGGFGLCPTWGLLTTCNGASNNNLSFSLS